VDSSDGSQPAVVGSALKPQLFCLAKKVARHKQKAVNLGQYFTLSREVLQYDRGDEIL